MHFKAGFNLNVVFLSLNMCLIERSRSPFKQHKTSMLTLQFYVLGCFINFSVIFRNIWEEIVFLKGLVKLVEIRNFEVDLP